MLFEWEITRNIGLLKHSPVLLRSERWNKYWNRLCGCNDHLHYRGFSACIHCSCSISSIFQEFFVEALQTILKFPSRWCIRRKQHNIRIWAHWTDETFVWSDPVEIKKSKIREMIGFSRRFTYTKLYTVWCNYIHKLFSAATLKFCYLLFNIGGYTLFEFTITSKRHDEFNRITFDIIYI